MQLNRFLQPVKLRSPGKIMRICSLLEAQCMQESMRLRDGVMRRTGRENDGGRAERKVCD